MKTMRLWLTGSWSSACETERRVFSQPWLSRLAFNTHVLESACSTYDWSRTLSAASLECRRNGQQGKSSSIQKMKPYGPESNTNDIINQIQTKAEFSHAMAVSDKVNCWKETALEMIGGEQGGCGIGGKLAGCMWIFTKAVTRNGEGNRKIKHQKRIYMIETVDEIGRAAEYWRTTDGFLDLLDDA